jgi:hypothetical protein
MKRAIINFLLLISKLNKTAVRCVTGNNPSLIVCRPGESVNIYQVFRQEVIDAFKE